MGEIYLRPLRVEDASTSYKWRNDSELWTYTGNRPDRIVTEKMEKEWAVAVIGDATRINFAICEARSNKYIGNIYLVHIADQEGELGLFIGDRSAHGRGYGGMALEALKEIVRRDFHLKRINIRVREENLAACKTYLHCGACTVGRDGDWLVMAIELGNDRVKAKG